MVFCSHELIQYVFSKHLLENNSGHKLSSFMVDCCHELVQYVFSKHLLDNKYDHKLCSFMVFCSHELVQYIFQTTYNCAHKLCIHIVYCSHELLECVFVKWILENNCGHKLCIIWYIVLMNCLNTLFQSIWSQIVQLYGFCSHELFKYVFDRHLFENSCVQLWSQTVHCRTKNKI